MFNKIFNHKKETVLLFSLFFIFIVALISIFYTIKASEKSSVTSTSKLQIKILDREGNIINSSQSYDKSFVDYTMRILRQKYNITQLSAGNITVVTTIDNKIQSEAVHNLLSAYTSLNTKYLFNGESAGMVSINPKNGEILSMIGDINNSNLNFVTLPGGYIPGKSILPLVYLSAFNHLGYAPTTFMPDIPISIQSNYTPINEDSKFLGNSSIEEDLLYGRQVPAIETLYTLGIDPFQNDLVNLGESMQTKISSTALGNVSTGSMGVELLNHVNTYATIANNGMFHSPVAIKKIIKDGKTIYSATEVGKSVIDPAYPYLINSILQNNPLFLEDTKRYDPQLLLKNYSIASIGGEAKSIDRLKLSNSSSLIYSASSLSYIAYTPDIVTGFWYGNESNQQKVLKSNGVYIPSSSYLIPYVDSYLENVLPQFSNDSFVRPADIVDQTVCTDSGLLATAGNPCSKSNNAIFQKDHIPTIDSSHIQTSSCVTTNLKTPDPSFQSFYNTFETTNAKKSC